MGNLVTPSWIRGLPWVAGCCVDLCQDHYMEQRIREMKKTRRAALRVGVDPSAHQKRRVSDHVWCFRTWLPIVYWFESCFILRSSSQDFPSTSCVFMSWHSLFFGELCPNMSVSQTNPMPWEKKHHILPDFDDFVGDIPTARQRPSGSGLGTYQWAITWGFPGFQWWTSKNSQHILYLNSYIYFVFRNSIFQ